MKEEINIENKYPQASLIAFEKCVLQKAGIKLHKGGQDFLKEIERLESPEFRNVIIKQRIKEFGLDDNTFNEYETFMKQILQKNNKKPGLKIQNYIDNVREFYSYCPFFYDNAKLFWIWNKNKCKYEIADEVDIINLLDNELGFCGQTVSSGTKNNYIEAFKRVGRDNIPKDIFNSWIQFQDQVYDINTGYTINASPDYFLTNPLPHKIGDSTNTPTMDRIFKQWVGEAYVDTLYEILAYCMFRDYPLHRIFCFVGSGLNGKSKYLELLTRFIGEENTTTTELDTLLTSRFEITRLHKKLVCIMGETDFSTLKRTSILKKLTGQDRIGFEYKNKNPFDDYSYAKILIATNNLPITEDKTRGFYRRWMIIMFPNEFTEQVDILDSIPPQEYENLTLKCIKILKGLLNDREFTNEGTIEDRQERYEEKSNVIINFIDERCIKGVELTQSFSEFHSQFNVWCKLHKHRPLPSKMVGILLGNEGYERRNMTITDYGDEIHQKKSTTKRVIYGLKLK